MNCKIVLQAYHQTFVQMPLPLPSVKMPTFLYTDAYTNVTVSVNQIQLLDSTVCTAIFMGL